MASDETNDEDLDDLRNQVTQLTDALATSRTIGAAIGIIMAQTKCTYDQAFEHLSHLSQDRNMKLRKVAEHIVLTGEVPT